MKAPDMGVGSSPEPEETSVDRQPKLSEIAHMACTSNSTVSRVYNGRGYVAKEKREQVEQLLQRYGYRDHEQAVHGSLSQRSSVLVAVESLDNDAYIEYISGISDRLQEAGFSAYVFVSGHAPDREAKELLRANASGYYGAVLLSAIETPALLSAMRFAKMPIVLLNRYLLSAEADTVVMDNFRVGYLATQYLLRVGHRRILHLAGPKLSTAAQDRQRGYETAMLAAGRMTGPTDVIRGDLSYTGSYRAAEQYAAGGLRHTAVFSENDTMARGFLDGLYAHGICCPQDISMICTENTRDSQSARVAITSIGYRNDELGRAAANLLLERAQTPKGDCKTISFSPKIVERDSVRRPDAP